MSVLGVKKDSRIQMNKKLPIKFLTQFGGSEQENQYLHLFMTNSTTVGNMKKIGITKQKQTLEAKRQQAVDSQNKADEKMYKKYLEKFKIDLPEPDIQDKKYKMKIELEEPTSSDTKDDKPAKNAIDGKKDTSFALKGDLPNGFWQSSFKISGSKVESVEIMSANTQAEANEAREAKIYVGDKLCIITEFPESIEISKVHKFRCDAPGDFVKIVAGESGKKLAFANVEVYANNAELFTQDTEAYDKEMTALRETMLFVFNQDDLNGKNKQGVNVNDVTIESLKIGTMKKKGTMYGFDQLTPVLQKVDPSFECQNKCLAQGFDYCMKKGDFNSLEEGECCSENACRDRHEGFCSSNTDDLEFKLMSCPTQACSYRNYKNELMQTLCKPDAEVPLVNECGSEKLLIPDRQSQGKIKHITLGVDRSEQLYNFCAYVLKSPEDMEMNDKLWVNFVILENAKVTLFYGDKRNFTYAYEENKDKAQMIQGMAKSVSNKEQHYILVEKADDEITYQGCYNEKADETDLGDVKTLQECQSKASKPMDSGQYFSNFGLFNGKKCWASQKTPNEQFKVSDDSLCNKPCNDDDTVMCGGEAHNSVYSLLLNRNKPSKISFDTFVEIGPPDVRNVTYAKILSKPISQNVTNFNIDSECNYKKIFKDEKSKKSFDDSFIQTCYKQSNCTLKPEDMTLYYKISEFCQDRISYLDITSYDFIVVVGCTKDTVLDPFSGTQIHKQKIAIAVVVLDIVSVFIMQFVFFKLKLINDKYITIVDNLQVQMKDFGVILNDVKIDKYTQDFRVQKMKIWTHFSEILKDYKSNDTDNMEVMDVTLSIYSLGLIQCVFKLQEIEIKMNSIKNLISVNNYRDKQLKAKQAEIKEWRIRSKRIKDQYIKQNTKKDKFEVNTQKIPKSKRTEQIQYVFIVFKNCNTESIIQQEIFPKISFVEIMIKYFFCIHIYKPKHGREKFQGFPLDFSDIVEPDEVIWKNLSTTGPAQKFRQFLTYFVTVLLILIVTIGSLYMNGLSQLVDQEVLVRECDAEINKNDAYWDKINKKVPETGLIGCYCRQQTNPLDFSTIYTHSFLDSQKFFKANGKLDQSEPTDQWNYCLIWWMMSTTKTIIMEIFDQSAVIINEGIAVFFKWFSMYQKQHTVIALQNTQFILIFLMEFINIGVIECFASFEKWHLVDSLMVGSIADQQTFTDYSSEWYMSVGGKICIVIFVSAFVSNIISILHFIIQSCKRFSDRNFKLSQMKQDLEDEDDDQPNSKIKVQSDLLKLYTGKEFEGEMAYSRMMSTLFVILMYSSGMPVLYVIGAIFFTTTYMIEKFLIINYYKRSQSLKRIVPVVAMQILRLGILLHMFNACIMLSNPDIFKVSEHDQDTKKLGFQKADLSTLTSSITNAEIGLEKKVLTAPQNGPKGVDQDLEASLSLQETLIDSMYSRFDHFHQQLYLIILICYFLLSFLAKTIFTIVYWITIGLFHWSKKVYSILKFALSMVHDWLRYSYELSQEDDDLEEIDDEGNELELNDEQQKEEEERLNLEEKIRELKEKRDKKKNRNDYSENILEELSCENLSNFYERSKKELQDFRDLFNLKPNEEIAMIAATKKGDDFGENKHKCAQDDKECKKMNQVFQEICYLMRMKPKEVIIYEAFLITRINEIEKVISSHFSLLADCFKAKLKKRFEKEAKSREDLGIVLSLQAKQEKFDEEEKAYKNDPSMQLDDLTYYPYTKKVRLLIQYQDEMITADKNRRMNTKCIQEYCRMTGSLSQSYFILDSIPFKVARKIYYTLGKENMYANEDDDFLKDLKGAGGEKGQEQKKDEGGETDVDDTKSKSSRRSKSKSNTQRSTNKGGTQRSSSRTPKNQ